MNFAFTDTVYELQTSATVSESVVDHDGFEEFCLRLQNLLRDISQLDDDSWTAPLRKLRHYRFDQCAAPIGFGNVGVMDPRKLDEIEREVRLCSLSYEGISNDASTMIKSLRTLVQANENPLFQKITGFLNGDYRTAILLKESRHISMLGEILKENPQWQNVQIVSQRQLAKLNFTFDQLLCVGRSSWFNEFVFRTPRSTETRVIRYSWLPDSDCRKIPNFYGWKGLRSKLEKVRKLSERKNPVFSIGTSIVRKRNWELSDENLIPKFDLAVVAERFQGGNASNDQAAFREDVQARLIELEGERGTFVECDSSGVLAITLDENNSGKVERIPINSVTPGIFLLLRGDSDSDDEHIIPIADLILGKEADQLRRFQRNWKAKLRAVVNDCGSKNTVQKLKEAGSTKASEVNLRNWLWHRNIRTDEPEDFFAIMRIIEMADERECWRYAKQIDSAHRRAGRKIRQELLRQIRETDMNELERLGEMRFELEGIGGRPMLAVRSLRISDFVSNVAPHNVNRLFHLEENFNG